MSLSPDPFFPQGSLTSDLAKFNHVAKTLVQYSHYRQYGAIYALYIYCNIMLHKQCKNITETITQQTN